MDTTAISVTELKNNLGAMLNRAAFGGERIILLSHGKERAALISIDDLRLLETLQAEKERSAYRYSQLALLDEARQLREQAAAEGYAADTSSLLDDIRAERSDELTDLR